MVANSNLTARCHKLLTHRTFNDKSISKDSTRPAVKSYFSERPPDENGEIPLKMFFFYCCMSKIKNEPSVSVCLKAKDTASGNSQTCHFQKLTDN